jgi:putative two-component system response regulator
MSVKHPHSKILVVDDNAANLELVEVMLGFAGYSNVLCISDPLAVRPIVREFGPDLIMLDLHMPGKHGLEVLAEVRELCGPDDFLPILVFTADGFPETRNSALAAGANDFLTKPGDFSEISLRVANFLAARHMYLRTRDQNRILEEMVAERTAELEESRLEILQKLAWTAEYRDDDTGEHTFRVAQLAAEIAKQLGMCAETTDRIRLATPLHDLGKVGIPDSTLLKPSKLTPEERELIKLHVEIGSRILADSKSPLLQTAETIARCHHERWDGTGYPDGLAREDIPLEARIVAVADVYDALINERPYKKAWSVEDAIREVRSLAGSWFDPDVIEAFLRVVGPAAQRRAA